MFADTFRLILTDVLVTMMLGIILIIQLMTGERYRDRLSEGRSMADEWKKQRQALAASARRLIRRIGFWVFVGGVVTLTIGTIFADQIKALNPPQCPILASEIAWVVLIVSCLGLFIALITREEGHQ